MIYKFLPTNSLTPTIEKNFFFKLKIFLQPFKKKNNKRIVTKQNNNMLKNLNEKFTLLQGTVTNFLKMKNPKNT